VLLFALFFPIRLLLRCRISSLPQVPFSPPGVDCDVGNLAIDKLRGLTLKKPGMVNVVPLSACVAHAQAKEFVFFYDLSGDARKMEFDRLTKYLGRGWVRRRPPAATPTIQTMSLVAKYGIASHACAMLVKCRVYSQPSKPCALPPP
jgi:hypothetical protein